MTRRDHEDEVDQLLYGYARDTQELERDCDPYHGDRAPAMDDCQLDEGIRATLVEAWVLYNRSDDGRR